MLHKEFARRDILKLGLIAGGAVLLAGCQKAVNMDLSASQLRSPDGATSKIIELIRYATLAANGHNTQPWKFRLLDDSIEIHPDTSRHLAVVDPQDREQWISLGCALENLIIAAGVSGFSSEIVYPNDKQGYINVALMASPPTTNALFDAIPVRQSTRSEYRAEAIAQEVLKKVYATATDPGVMLQFIDGKVETERVLEYVNEGNLKQYADKAFLDELISWLRFNKNEAISSMDGLFTKCTGNPTVPRWLGEMFVSGTKPQSQADSDAKKLRSSAGVVLLSSETDTPESWVRCGQVFERLSLQLTSLGLKSALLNQPIEVPELRRQFQSAMGLGANMPQLILRYGIADAMPYSMRRPVDDLLM